MISYKNEPHVLLVDDNVDFAKEYAEIFQNQCHTTVVYATTAKDALDIVKKNPIKVVILDQVMPTKGTELFKQLKRIDPNLKTILLTSEAEGHDLTEATNIGFDYALWKDEIDLNRIPTMILILLMKYNVTTIPENSSPFFVLNQGGIFRKKYHVEYSVVAYEIIDEAYVFPNSWITRNLVERGTSLSLEEEINIEKEFNFQNDFHIDNEQMLDFRQENFIDFKTELTLKMEQDFKSTYTESLKRVINRKGKFEINDDTEGIVSRVYEYAKVYNMVKVYLQKTCSCCKSKTIDAMTVYLPIPVIKYRICEYYDDGNIKELTSGELRGR